VNSARIRNILVYALVFIAIGFVVVQFWNSNNAKSSDISLSQLATALNEGTVKKIVVNDNVLQVTFTNGTVSEARKEPTSTGGARRSAGQAECPKLGDPETLRLDRHPHFPGLHPAGLARCGLVLFHAPASAGHKQPGHRFWQEPGAHVQRRPTHRDV